MKDYMFVLGRDSGLTILELIAYFQKNNMAFSIKEISEQTMTLSVDEKFEPVTAMKSLGGTVKIGIIIENLDEIYQGKKNKIKYAISFYGKNDEERVEDQIKEFFKEQKLKAFYKKPKREKALMPNEVIKQKLLEGGIEFLACKNVLAKTVAVFNPFEHEKRDQEMPYKDYRKTISIRLAKILINLSQAKKLLLDPFCGHGVILQEATLQGLDVIGIDRDIKSVESAKKNIEHVEKKYGTKTKHAVIRGDSRHMTRLIREADGMATEPYLGPYLKRIPSLEEAKNTMAELEQLYKRVLEESKKIVKGKVAIIVPRFSTQQRKDVTMNFNQIITELGYKVWQPLKQVKMPVVYPYGRLIREIWIIEQA
jgi:tRNA G10  N-methylase Trm11